MAGRNQHVIPHQGKWAVKGEGSQRATSIHETQAEATDKARDLARRQKSELLVHGRDAEIRSRASFGHDPSRRKVEQPSSLRLYADKSPIASIRPSTLAFLRFLETGPR